MPYAGGCFRGKKERSLFFPTLFVQHQITLCTTKNHFQPCGIWWVQSQASIGVVVCKVLVYDARVHVAEDQVSMLFFATGYSRRRAHGAVQDAALHVTLVRKRRVGAVAAGVATQA